MVLMTKDIPENEIFFAIYDNITDENDDDLKYHMEKDDDIMDDDYVYEDDNEDDDYVYEGDNEIEE